MEKQKLRKRKLTTLEHDEVLLVPRDDLLASGGAVAGIGRQPAPAVRHARSPPAAGCPPPTGAPPTPCVPAGHGVFSHGVALSLQAVLRPLPHLRAWGAWQRMLGAVMV